MAVQNRKLDPDRAYNIAQEVLNELAAAIAEHAPMHSGHEGYAVIKEELDELWEEVRKKKQHPDRMRKEATQVAAMAMRFLYDVLGAGIPEPYYPARP
jgi:hypothetical protein